jgi:hypothetical protein
VEPFDADTDGAAESRRCGLSCVSAAHDPKLLRRFAELVGYGCSEPAAARAVEISLSTGERLLQDTPLSIVPA